MGRNVASKPQYLEMISRESERERALANRRALECKGSLIVFFAFFFALIFRNLIFLGVASVSAGSDTYEAKGQSRTSKIKT